jgi:hypothetical protein
LTLRWLLDPKDVSENWTGCTRFCLWHCFEISRHHYPPENMSKQLYTIKSNRDYDSKIVTPLESRRRNSTRVPTIFGDFRRRSTLRIRNKHRISLPSSPQTRKLKSALKLKGKRLQKPCPGPLGAQGMLLGEIIHRLGDRRRRRIEGSTITLKDSSHNSICLQSWAWRR